MNTLKLAQQLQHRIMDLIAEDNAAMRNNTGAMPHEVREQILSMAMLQSARHQMAGVVSALLAAGLEDATPAAPKPAPVPPEMALPPYIYGEFRGKPLTVPDGYVLIPKGETVYGDTAYLTLRNGEYKWEKQGATVPYKAGVYFTNSVGNIAQARKVWS